MPKNEEKIKDTQEKVEETKDLKETETQQEAPKDDKVDEKVDEKVEETKETEQKTEEKVDEKPNEQEQGEEQPVVEETKSQVNAISINDIMTKDDFNARFNALEDKINALIQENSQLKEQNAQLLDGKNNAEKEAQGLKDKYENTSFGNVNKQGEINTSQNTQKPYQSFEEYSRQFM